MTDPRGDRRLGQHIRSLRTARGLTQAELAARSNMSPDALRGIEHADLCPNLVTLRKAADGLELRMSTLFWGRELGERDIARELLDLVGGRSSCEVELATRLLRALFAELDAAKTELEAFIRTLRS